MAAFFEPARNAVIPNIAAKGEVLVANTLSSATWSVNLLIGASVGGVVAAFLRARRSIRSERSLIPGFGLLNRRNAFAEPHAESAASLRPRDLVDFSPVLEGIRYVRNHRTLLPTVFAKAGELMIGPSWVIFTVLGAREFAVHWRNVDAAGGAMLGMSILLGGRGLGALCRPARRRRAGRAAATAVCRSAFSLVTSSSPGIRHAGTLPHRMDGRCVCHAAHMREGRSSGYFPPRYCSFIPTIDSAAASSPPTWASPCSPSPPALTCADACSMPARPRARSQPIRASC